MVSLKLLVSIQEITLHSSTYGNTTEVSRLFLKKPVTLRLANTQPPAVKYDREIWKEAEKASGVLWGEALAAYARINIGDEPPELEERVSSEVML